MRTLLAVSALVAAMWVWPPLCAADEAKKVGGGGLAERIQDLNLTDEQETKIAGIQKEFRPKVQEAGKELAAIVKEETEKVRAVLTPEQKEKLQASKEERREGKIEGLAAHVAHLRELDLTESEMSQITEIRKQYHPKIVSAMKGLEDILSDQQKETRAEALKEGKKRRQVLESLKFTDEQKEKVQAVAQELAVLVREEMEKFNDVLTAEQKEAIPDLKDERQERVRDRHAHRIANLKDLNLTDDQKTKIMEIRKEYRPRVQEAGNKLRATIREELAMVVGVIKGT